ncbi:hypothetical protein JRO89_XS06G0060000 [Xanthoceras sorbifolium]|uniref:LOB domain-containing protein n=1 Tax=Xanthoceras sorbifolium TaxID=99658 RepID=A0ABQ8HWV1_9ROSI|nr:hypothetical protein JRO89_XS06G0060000 [Xanthoceras sorbifolium]
MSTGSSNINVEESSNRHACAACKHQRRKCEPNCILAPYFPSDMNDKFQSILNVFGVCKVTKLLSKLNEIEREQAVRSLLWEAEAWKHDGVHGPLGLYTELHQENELLKNMLKQLQQQQQPNQVIPYGMSSLDPGPIGRANVPNDGNHAVFNQNWRPQGSQMSNYTGFGQEEDIKSQIVDCIGFGAPQYNKDTLNQQGRGLAIAEPSINAVSHYHRNIPSQCQGRDFNASREPGSRVVEGQDQRVVNQRGGFVAQGNYGDHHHHHVSSLQRISQGRGGTIGTSYTPYPNLDSNLVRPEIGQENYYDYHQLNLQQQQPPRRQHMPNTHHLR